MVQWGNFVWDFKFEQSALSTICRRHKSFLSKTITLEENYKIHSKSSKSFVENQVENISDSNQSDENSILEKVPHKTDLRVNFVSLQEKMEEFSNIVSKEVTTDTDKKLFNTVISFSIYFNN